MPRVMLLAYDADKDNSPCFKVCVANVLLIFAIVFSFACRRQRHVALLQNVLVVAKDISNALATQ